MVAMRRLGVHMRGRASGLRDKTVARDMGEFAEVFLEGAAADDFPLDYDLASARRLEELCAMFVAGEPVEGTRNGMAMSMGAYVGELVVRLQGARWMHDHDRNQAAVETADGERLYPHRAVHRRLTGEGDDELQAIVARLVV